jgi:NADH-quinone oxidoreductase subunit N
MSLFLLSLAGVPPLAGFLAKFYLFESAVVNRLYVLVVIGVLNSALSAYYYLRVLVVMYMQGPPASWPEPARSNQSGAMVVNILMAAVVVLAGVFPHMVLIFIEKLALIRMLTLPLH